MGWATATVNIKEFEKLKKAAIKHRDEEYGEEEGVVEALFDGEESKIEWEIEEIDGDSLLIRTKVGPVESWVSVELSNEDYAILGQNIINKFSKARDYFKTMSP